MAFSGEKAIDTVVWIHQNAINKRKIEMIKK